MASIYQALVKQSLMVEPKDGSTAARAIPAPYDKNLFEILYPDKAYNKTAAVPENRESS